MGWRWQIYFHKYCASRHSTKLRGWAGTPQFGGKKIEGHVDVPHQITKVGERANMALFTMSFKIRARGTQWMRRKITLKGCLSPVWGCMCWGRTRGWDGTKWWSLPWSVTAPHCCCGRGSTDPQAVPMSSWKSPQSFLIFLPFPYILGREKDIWIWAEEKVLWLFSQAQESAIVRIMWKEKSSQSQFSHTFCLFAC